MKALPGLLLLALCGPALGQDKALCPGPAEVTQAHMLGLWRADFQGSWHGATLRIAPHPEYALSLSGAIERGSARGLLAGDLESGALTLEESDDGKRIAAVFLGEVVAGSCGREIRGTWTRDGEAEGIGFVLRKQPD